MRRGDLPYFDWAGKNAEYSRMYHEGASHRQLANHFGCTVDQSARHRRRLKLPPRPERNQFGHHATEEARQKIRDLAKLYYPTAQIARAVGVDHETVRKQRMAEGLPLWDGVAYMPGEKMPPRSSVALIKQPPVVDADVGGERIADGPEPLPPGHPVTLAAIGMTYQEFVSVRAR